MKAIFYLTAPYLERQEIIILLSKISKSIPLNCFAYYNELKHETLYHTIKYIVYKSNLQLYFTYYTSRGGYETLQYNIQKPHKEIFNKLVS